MIKSKSGIALVLPLIQTVRGQRVIIDADLARLYGVSTTRLNQQARRNHRRFPSDFAFHLTQAEVSMLLHIATASRKRNRGKPPVAYTEHGTVMAANVLNSSRAIAMSVEVVRAFVRLRKTLLSHDLLSKKIAELERTVKTRLDDHDLEIGLLFQTIESLLNEKP
jgi:hypothetical protein